MPMEEKIRVVIADDHPLIRAGIKQLLEKLSDIVLVGEASNGQEAIRMIETHKPDLLVLDLQMPIMDGIEVVKYLRKHNNKVIIIILSAQDDPTMIKHILSLGVWGYYLKDDASTHLIEAIRRSVR